jgi:ABC-2 type transport system permease protein
MVGLLIRLKLTLLRHSLSGGQALWAIVGGGFVVTIAAFNLGDAIGSAELLATKFAVWTLGWLAATLFVGSGDAAIPQAYLRLLAIPPRRLAFGLLGAALVGVGPILSMLLFAKLLVYGVGLGFGPGLIAVPAVLLQLVMTILLTRVVGELLGAVVRTRTRAVSAALVSASLTAIGASGWALIPVLDRLRADGFSSTFATLVRALPTGWGVVAMEAAGHGNWPLTLGALAGMIMFCWLLLAIWGNLLTRQTMVRGSGFAAGSATSALARLAQRALPVTPTGAVVARELRSWWRDLTRIGYLAFALFYGLILCLVPLVSGWAGLVPWTGALVALMAAAVSANLYGVDGTALWLTIVTPGAARADVRGRQAAWLLAVGPLALLLTVLFTLVSGQTSSWPWVLAILPALLGGTTGLLVLLAVLHLIPVRDPYKRRGNLLEDGIDPLQVVLMAGLGALSALPAMMIVWAGGQLQSPALQWAGVPVGIGTGALCYWGLGLLAYRRLELRGPELLLAMRRGLPAHRGVVIARRADRSPANALGTLLQWKSLWPRSAAGGPPRWALAPRPDGGVEGGGALAHLAGGADARRWFLPLYYVVPRELWWQTSVALLLIGLAACSLFTWLMRQRYQLD